jgi:hypothetical protein
MFSRHFVRALALGLVLTSAAQAAWAGPHQSPEVPVSAWEFVAGLWHSFTSSWLDVGCIIDPNGGCDAAQALVLPPETEVGCILDPHGGCGAAQASAPPEDPEVGCILDPNGGCGPGR